MKILPLFFLFTFLPGLVCSQEKNSAEGKKSEELKYELGGNFCSVLELSGIDHLYTTTKSYLNGLMFKKHSGDKALRLGFDIMHFRLGEVENKIFPDMNKRGTTLAGELRAGVEKEFRLGKFRPFIAADLLFSYSHSPYNVIFSGFHPYDYSYLHKRGYIGIAPAIGLKFQVCEKMSLTLETNLILFAFQEKLAIRDNNSLAKDSWTSSGFEGYFNPVRLLSLNYHFNQL
jgi:hypothetical protein